MERYQIIEHESKGIISYRLSDRKSGVEAEISPQLGNNLFRISVNGRDILAYPTDVSQLEKASDRYGIPVLFPPNRVRNGKFTYEGATYQLNLNNAPHHIHGEIRNRPWKVTETGVDKNKGAYITCEFRFKDHADLLATFVHPYCITFTYGLQDGELYLKGEVKNEREEIAPLFLGFHPYFKIDSDLMQYHDLEIDASEEWPIDSDGFIQSNPTETELCLKLRDQVTIGEFPNQGYRLFSLQKNGLFACRIIDRKNQMTIIYETGENFPFIAVFIPKWISGISIEPYTCVTDAFNLLTSEKQTGVQGIQPGGTFNFTHKFRFLNS